MEGVAVFLPLFGAGGAPVPVVVWLPVCSVVVSDEPSGRILSVSRRMSLMFCSRVPQKWLFEVFVTWVVELLLPAPAAPPAAPPAPLPVVAIWVAMLTLLLVSRMMLT